ncbi:hypothetical protein LA52FAK_36380 [Desulforhopalus sp. 52FAK]
MALKDETCLIALKESCRRVNSYGDLNGTLGLNADIYILILFCGREVKDEVTVFDGALAKEDLVPCCTGKGYCFIMGHIQVYLIQEWVADLKNRIWSGF